MLYKLEQDDFCTLAKNFIRSFFYLYFYFLLEKFIDGVVNQLGRQSVNVDTLTQKNLDQLSKAITQALQVVDGVEGVKGREATQDEVEVKREPSQESHQVEKLEDGTTQKGSNPLTKINIWLGPRYTCFKSPVTAVKFWKSWSIKSHDLYHNLKFCSQKLKRKKLALNPMTR